MTCMHCQGKMERDTVPFSLDRQGIHVRLDEVPAWVCTQCGEAYFEGSEVEAIQGLLQSLDQHAAKLAESA